MKKKVLLLAASACTISLLAGCSSSPKNTYKDYLTLGEYKGLDLTMIKTEVTDDMIQDEIDYFLEDNATYTEITDRAAEENDTVNVNYTGTIDGEEFEDGSAEDFDLVIGEGYLLDELEAGLVGMTAGETKEISATFPEDYYDETVAGKAAVFSVTLNKISVEEIPEYTDEFVASVTDYSTTAEYEESLKSDLYASSESDNRSTAGMEALSKVVENSTFDGYPQELYDACKKEYDAMNQMYAEMFGLDVSELEDSEEETKSTIESMVYEKMVCTTIAENEKLEVSEEDYKQYLENNYEVYGYESAEEYEAGETKEAIMDEILSEMVQDFLIENANVTEVSEDEYYEDEYSDGEYLDDEEFSDDGEELLEDGEELLDGEEPDMGETDTEEPAE